MNKMTDIKYHIVNSLLAGALVFLGGFAAGSITWETVGLSAAASLVVAITKFKAFWEEKCMKKKGTAKLFSFVG